MTNIDSFVKQLRTELVFEAETEKAVQGIDALNKRLEATAKAADKSKQTFSELTEASGRLAAAGGLIFAPAVLSAQAYVQAMGRTDAVSRKFIQAQERQAKAQQELGRKATAALTPYYEALANITELISKLPQGVVEAGIAIGSGLVLVGAIGVLGGQIGVFVATSTKLIASLNANVAIAGLGGAGNIAKYAGVGGLAIAGGTAAGIGLTRIFGQATGDDRLAQYGLDDAFETFKQVLLIGADQLTDAIENMVKTWIYLGAEWDKFTLALDDKFKGLIAIIQGVITSIEEALLDTELFGKNLGEQLGLERKLVTGRRGDTTEGGEAPLTLEQKQRQIDQDAQDTIDTVENFFQSMRQSAADVLGYGENESSADDYSTEALDMFAQFQEDSLALQNSYYSERTAKQKAFEDESLKLQETYNEQQQKLTESYNEQRKAAEAQLQRKVAELRNAAQTDLLDRELQYREERGALQADFEKEEQQAIEAYNRKRVQAEKDFQDQLRNAAAKLDAISVLDILRNQNKQRGTDSDQFSLESKQRKEELQDRLADLDRGYAKEKQKRQEQLRQQIADAEKAFTEQQRTARQAYEKQQREAAEQYRKLQNERATAHTKELEQLRVQHNRAMQLRQQQYQDQYNQLMAFGRYSADGMRQYYEQLKRQFESYTNRVTTPAQVSQAASNITKGLRFFDTGGYTSEGEAYLHDDEYVMTAATTKAAERGMGALTQQKLQQAFNSTSNSIGNIAININGAQQPQNVAREVRRELISVLRSMKAT